MMLTPYETVLGLAREVGVNPALALSVWQQESGGSTDTGLRGAALSNGRGNAVGPWQVVPYYHPEFPAQGTFEDQTRYALNYLKQVGPAGYYGRGQAPAGFPTTDQYVNQVQNRAMQLAQTGQPKGLFAEVPTMAGQQAPQPMTPPQGFPQPQPPGFWDRFMGSPATNMGLGILASNTGNYGAWGPAIGRGAMLGMQNVGAMQEGQTQAQMQQIQMELARRKWQKDMQDAQYVEEWLSTLPPEMQKLGRAAGPESLAKFLMEQQAGPKPTDTMKNYNEAVKQGFTGTLMDYQKALKPEPSNVSVQIGNEAEKKFQEIGINRINTSLAAAENAVSVIPDIQRMRDLVNSGVIMGFAAGGRAKVAQGSNFILKQLLGREDPENDQMIARTQMLTRDMAARTIKAYSQLRGTGQVTEREMELLRQAEAGDLNWDQATMIEFLDLAERRARELVDYYGKDREAFVGELADKKPPWWLRSIEPPKPYVFNKKKMPTLGPDGVWRVQP